MASIAGAQALYRALAGVQRDVGAALQVASDRIGGTIQRSADRDGRVPVERLRDVQTAAGDAIDETFAGPDKRQPFERDGVTPRSPYAKALNYWLAYATFGAVVGHSQFMQGHLPDNLRMWLKSARPVVPAGFIAPHAWVDDRGLVLSDRIWQAGVRTRLKIEGIIADGIRSGKSAIAMSKELEQFLLPNRAPIKTNKPYGSTASFDGLRLARTEVARAHGQATIAAVRSNPYTEKIAWRLSARHPRVDICDDYQANGPYEPDNLPPYPAHPQCICYLVPIVTRTPSEVAAELRDEMDAGSEPPFTPVQADSFVELLIGAYLLNLIRERIQTAA